MSAILKNYAETKKFLKKLSKTLKNILAKKSNLVILFKGHLGAGKTTFIKEIAKNFGISSFLKSPTFIIWQIYQFSFKKNLFYFNHIDLYRISAKEIFKLNLKKKLREKNNIFFIEWGEKIEKYLKEYILIEIEILKKRARKVSIKYNFKNGIRENNCS